jgi:hypothetical protein
LGPHFIPCFPQEFRERRGGDTYNLAAASEPDLPGGVRGTCGVDSRKRRNEFLERDLGLRDRRSGG